MTTSGISHSPVIHRLQSKKNTLMRLALLPKVGMVKANAIQTRGSGKAAPPTCLHRLA